MNAVGQPERATQDRIIVLFRDELGCRYLGDWTDRGGNARKALSTGRLRFMMPLPVETVA